MTILRQTKGILALAISLILITTTLNLRVPRVADDTSLVAEVVVAPRSVHAPLDHSCHW